MITQQAALNTTALVVPDLYVQLVSPAVTLLNGVPSNVIGTVGSASWGPIGQPVVIGAMADYARIFGPVMARSCDMGTHVAVAIQQGATAFRCVRVTDGSETAATGPGPAGCIGFTALYPGSVGNLISLTLAAGSKAGSWAAIIGLAGQAPERFDNIEGTGAAFWTALASAINTGNGQITARASRLITAITLGGVTAPAAGQFTLAGGTDGADGVTSATLIGTMAPLSGMYALTGQGCAILDLCDCTDASHWPDVEVFAASEGIYAMLAGPAGDTIAHAISVKTSAGIDSSAVKLLFGDCLSWWDAANQTQRLVSPQAFAAGRLANLSPEQSGLNKPLYAIAGSQGVGLPGSGLTRAYSAAELELLFSAGIDVITTPSAGGQMIWSLRLGHNSAGNPAINGDAYTRLTNYIAATLSAGMGLYVGQVINLALLRSIRSTLLSFLASLQSQGLLGSTDGSAPFAVLCDSVNNPASRTALGYVQADVQIRYQGINEKFIVNLDGGAGVLVSTSGTSGGGSSGGGGSGGDGGSGGSGGSGTTTLSFQTPPIGPYTASETNIGVNAMLAPGSATASIEFGWSTSATAAPASWTAGAYVNSQSNGDALYGAYLTAPATAGTYYGWVSTVDGSVHAVSSAVTVS
ncbi:phage tail sheath protein [Acidisoma cellulosilyticum]|uniref:phage tail protein n=1 Tax=Acidisoma cellulosilyticum TaxID=2802395 RepID=UPI001D0B6F4C|nr:phage tail protein [Acidisoma cellulosilyticum]